jgi:hypothetical protein
VMDDFDFLVSILVITLVIWWTVELLGDRG